MAGDFISDDDMAKLEAQHASAPDFISDDDMAKMEQPQDQRSAYDSMPWEVQATDPNAIGAAAGQVGRSIPVLGPAVVNAGHGLAALLTKITPDGVLPENLRNKTVGELYHYYKGLDDAQQAQVQQQYPKAAMAGSLGGAAMLGNPLAMEAPVGAGLATKVGTGLVNAGTYGQLLQGDALVRGQEPDQAQNAGDIAAAVGSVIPAAQIAGRIGSQAGKLAASTMFGVSGKAVDSYLENPEAVNGAMKYAEDPGLLKSEIDGTVNKVTANVDSAKAGVDVAKTAANDAKAVARYERAVAQMKAADAWRAAKEVLNNTGAPEGMAGNIVDSLGQQGEKLSQLSSQAFDVLADEGQTFGVNDLTGSIDKQLNSLKIGGVPPAIGPQAQAYNALGQFKDMVERIGEKAKLSSGELTPELADQMANGEDGVSFPSDLDAEIPAPVVKQLIQNLDSVSKAAYQTNAGEMSPEAARSLASVRGMFDRALKDSSPAYSSKMAELAPQVQLVSEMSKVFGDDQSAMSALKAAGDGNSPRGYMVRQLLQQYDAANGTDFTKKLASYFKAREILQSPTALEAFRQSLPDVKAVAGKLPDEITMEATQQALGEAQQNLKGAQAWGSSVSKLGPNSTENVIKTVQGGRGAEIQKQLSNLDEMYGTSHLQDIQNSGTARQFTRPSTNGSRKVQAFSRIAEGLGAAALGGGAIASSPGIAIAGAVGAGVGALADIYGGQAVKAALDAGIAINKLAGTKYIAPIMEAAKRGPQAAAVTHYLLSQQDPGYQNHLQSQSSASGAFPRQVKNAKTGATATVSNADELAEAMSEGFQ